MDATSLRDYATEAIRYWEPKRIGYKLALAAVVVACFIVRLPVSKHTLTADTLLSLVAVTIVANIFYCAAYVADVFVQMSAFREQWRAYRWMLFFIGLTFASILTRFGALGFFFPGSYY